MVPNTSENSSAMSELDYLKKYKIFTDNLPIYWDSLKQNISRYVPEANFISIHSVTTTVALICANQGISYLPFYSLKAGLPEQLRIVHSDCIQDSQFFLCLIWKNANPCIDLFRNFFTDYLKAEQQKTAAYHEGQLPFEQDVMKK